MFMSFPNIPRNHIMFIDIEFDDDRILQLSGMIFNRAVGDLFNLVDSFNFYVKREEVSYYTEKYTGLTSEFLLKNGMKHKDFMNEFNNILQKLPLKDTILVSHGVRNDRKVLKKTGFNKLPEHSYCTFRNAGKILERKDQLSLRHLSQEAGLKFNFSHNAAYDALATAAVCSYLLNKK